MCVFLNPRSIRLQTFAQGKEGRKSKKLLLNIYLLSIALTLSLFVYGLSLSNTHPTKGFRARSEDGTESCVCLFKTAQNILSKFCSRKRKKKKLLLIIYTLFIALVLIICVWSLPFKHAPYQGLQS